MILTADRTGGLAGWHERLGPVDTSAVPNGEALDQLIAEADFFNLPNEYKEARRVYDGYRNTLAVEDADRTHTVTWSTGSDVPDSLHRILGAMDESSDWERVER